MKIWITKKFTLVTRWKRFDEKSKTSRLVHSKMWIIFSILKRS